MTNEDVRIRNGVVLRLLVYECCRLVTYFKINERKNRERINGTKDEF